MIYLQLFISFFKLGIVTFGGGYAMLPLIENEVVSVKKWANEEEIYDIFAVAQSVPGAVAINTATLVGYKLGGAMGACIATLGVIFPSYLVIVIVAMFLPIYRIYHR